MREAISVDEFKERRKVVFQDHISKILREVNYELPRGDISEGAVYIAVDFGFAPVEEAISFVEVMFLKLGWLEVCLAVSDEDDEVFNCTFRFEPYEEDSEGAEGGEDDDSANGTNGTSGLDAWAIDAAKPEPC